MRNAFSMANKAVQKINEDDMSSRPKWKKNNKAQLILKLRQETEDTAMNTDQGLEKQY